MILTKLWKYVNITLVWALEDQFSLIFYFIYFLSVPFSTQEKNKLFFELIGQMPTIISFVF